MRPDRSPRAGRPRPRQRRPGGAAARCGCAVGLALLASWPVAAAAAAGSGLVWPLEPPHRVVRGFQPPETAFGPGHRGVDLAAAAGARVMTAGAGIVTFAGPVAGRGVVVVAHDGGLRTTYEPVEPTVRAGERVLAGHQVGRLSLAGSHCLPRACLHWGAIRGDYLDPLTLLGVGRGPPRLLPVWRGTGAGQGPVVAGHRPGAAAFRAPAPGPVVGKAASPAAARPAAATAGSVAAPASEPPSATGPAAPSLAVGTGFAAASGAAAAAVLGAGRRRRVRRRPP